jgi:hypothetical protein
MISSPLLQSHSWGCALPTRGGSCDCAPGQLSRLHQQDLERVRRAAHVLLTQHTADAVGGVE